MALRNAFGDLASEESLKKIHDAHVDGSQKTRIVPISTGGLSVYRNINLVASGVNIKSSAGQIYGWYLFNNAPTVRYIKLYNKAKAPSVGADTPAMTIPLPCGAAANVIVPSGIAFSHGIGIGATTGVGDGNVGMPAPNEVVVNIIYF
jgi:hypothetical protein